MSCAHHEVLDPGIHFIQKPFSMSDQARTIRETLRDDKRSHKNFQENVKYASPPSFLLKDVIDFFL